jgi:hypothetical protein
MRPAFERSLKLIVKPALEQCGFTPHKSREFVLDGHGRIEFQLGVRFMAGKFTVNVIIGNELKRLGELRETSWTRLMDRIFGMKPTFLKTLLMPRDKWWPLSEDQATMDGTMNDVLDRLLRDAVPRIQR